MLFNTQVVSTEVIMPSTLTSDTSSFVLLSDFGTTPSISGYSGTLLISAVASAGNIKITTTNEWNYRLNIHRLIRSNEDFENSLDLSISKVF